QRLCVTAVVAAGGHGECMRPNDLGNRSGNRDLLAVVGVRVTQDLAAGDATSPAGTHAGTARAALRGCGLVSCWSISASPASAEDQRRRGGESDETHPCYCTTLLFHDIFPDSPTRRGQTEQRRSIGLPGGATTARQVTWLLLDCYPGWA